METFKKRQKAWARKEKQQKKAARKMERRNEKAKSPDGVEETNSTNPESSGQQGPTIL
jgi:organic hydroperoxide reductase OsmC/OhrA